MIFRLARDADAQACLDIYRPFIQHTAVSFETEVPTLEAFQARIRETQLRMPWLVCEQEGQVAGYAYGVPFRIRPAYRFSAEVTVYIAEQRRGQGVGRALYSRLFTILRHQGLINAMAVITLPNAPSQALHAAMGFEKIGAFSKVGYKRGNWHDTEWWLTSLQPAPDNPGEPRSLHEVAGEMAWLEGE